MKTLNELHLRPFSFLSPQEPRIADVVEDTTPQLGGALDPNGYAIEGGGHDGYAIEGGECGEVDCDWEWWG